MLNTRQIPSLLFAAGGIASLAVGAIRWSALPHYSDQDIDAATELNLSLDLARAGTAAPSPEQLAAQRETVRGEVLATIAAPRDSARGYVLGGALLLLVSAARWWLLRKFAARSGPA